SSPVPFLIARSMLSLGMFTALASSIALRSRGLPLGSPPPALAATVISRITLVQVPARRASATAFLCLIDFHLLCPAICFLLLTRDSSYPARLAATHRRLPISQSQATVTR